MFGRQEGAMNFKQWLLSVDSFHLQRRLQPSLLRSSISMCKYLWYRSTLLCAVLGYPRAGDIISDKCLDQSRARLTPNF